MYYVGLQYAIEEVGGDPSKPMYHCSLCGVTTTDGNKEVHFKCSNHIQKVLVSESVLRLISKYFA